MNRTRNPIPADMRNYLKAGFGVEDAVVHFDVAPGVLLRAIIDDPALAGHSRILCAWLKPIIRKMPRLVR